MKKSDLEKIIQDAVRTEVKKYVATILPLVVNEVLEYKLSKKSVAKTLNEVVSKEIDEEWPTVSLGNPTKPNKKTSILGTSNLAEILGYGDTKPLKGELKIMEPASFEAVTEHGTPVEVSAKEVPDYLKKALSRDYRPLVKALDIKKKA